MEIIARLAVVGVTMGMIDALWLSVVANKFYKSQIGELLLAKPNMIAAVSFYAIYVIGIVVFVLTPALQKNSWQYALGYGALFGFIAYATYDLTNLATLKGWSLKLVVVDMMWGAVLTGVVAVLSFLVLQAWKG